MKFRFIVAALIFLFGSVNLVAQFACIPEPAATFSVKAMNEINPKHVSWVKITAADTRSDKIAVDDVQVQASTYGQHGKLAEGDIMALAFLVMMEASKSAQEDLKAIMDSVKAMNEKKKALREAMSLLKKRKSEKKTLLRAEYDSLKTVLVNADLDSVKKQAPAVPVPAKPARATTITSAEFNLLTDEYRDKLDSMNEMGEMQSLRLQMLMDRMNKMISTLANMLKKIGDTQTQIISNLK